MKQTIKEKISIPEYSLGEELMNAITHGVGVLFSVAALVLSVVFSAIHGNAWAVVASAIYGASLIILYMMSTMYHSLKVNNAKRVFRILDHCTIYFSDCGNIYSVYPRFSQRSRRLDAFRYRLGRGDPRNSFQRCKYKQIQDNFLYSVYRDGLGHNLCFQTSLRSHRFRGRRVASRRRRCVYRRRGVLRLRKKMQIYPFRFSYFRSARQRMSLYFDIPLRYLNRINTEIEKPSGFSLFYYLSRKRY